MDDEASEISKRRLKILREQAAYHGIDCPPAIRMEIEDIEKLLKEHPNSISLALSGSTDGGNKAVIKNIVVISVVTGAVVAVYVLWSLARPLTVDLMVANLSFGTTIGFFIALVIELATLKFQK